jgi:2-hydroxychromene-2-carboxylate isomerase
MSEPACVRFWFDFISPNAYIAWTQIGTLVARCGARLEPLPVLYAALLDAHDLSGPAERPAKRAWMVASVMRKVAQLGIPFGPPPSHPFNPLLALRCCTVEMDREERLRLIDALFRAAWGGGGGVTEPAAVAAAARDAGLEGEALVRRAGTTEVKNRLRRVTGEAIEAGVFGVPTMTVGDELFWGYDDFPWLERMLRGEDLVDDGTRRKWLAVQPSAIRRAARPRGDETQDGGAS